MPVKRSYSRIIGGRLARQVARARILYCLAAADIVVRSTVAAQPEPFLRVDYYLVTEH